MKYIIKSRIFLIWEKHNRCASHCTKNKTVSKKLKKVQINCISELKASACQDVNFQIDLILPWKKSHLNVLGNWQINTKIYLER